MKKNSHNGYSWETWNELEYLSAIGLWRKGRVLNERKSMVRRYYRAALRRGNWQGIDRDKVLKACEEELGVG